MNPSTKLRLMCSNGGHIIPRPHDKTLCYIGGETHIIIIDRHTTLLDLTHRLSKTLLQSSSSSPSPTSAPLKGCFPFTIKYQLPSEDLDSLISLTSDEDLQYMIQEYDNFNLNSCSRIRVFVFPTGQPVLVTASGLQSVLKSEEWFVNVLNGTRLLGVCDTDTSSFGCLLDMDEEIVLPGKKDVGMKGMGLNGNGSGQDVDSLPDSVVMETTSSFGSDSSLPLVGNLPLIKVNAVDHQKVIGGVEERCLSSDVAGNNDRAADPNDTIDQTARIQTQPQIQNPACLLSMAKTQIDSPRNQLNRQQPQFIPSPQYIHHHPSVAVPVASYYHQPPTDQQSFMYYMPTRQMPQGYNFPVQQPQASYDAPLAAAAIHPSDQTELLAGGYRTTTNSGASQPVRGSYVGYSEIHQPSQLMYYATQAIPQLSAAHYKNMASMSPFEDSLQEHVRSALP